MHHAETILRAHLEDPVSTEASIGALYALLIAAHEADSTIDWPGVHGAIKRRFRPTSQDAWLRQLDRVKTHGWKLYEATAKALSRQDTQRTGSRH